MPICYLEILDSDWLILFVHLLRNILRDYGRRCYYVTTEEDVG